MDLKTAALAMYPCWLAGAFAIWATIKSGKKEVVRIEKPAIFSWIRFLFMVTLYRVVMFTLFPDLFADSAKAVNTIPWPLTLTVFWEDACHGLPLFLLMGFIGTEKWWKWLIHVPVIALVMLEFGLGHMYQGAVAATFLSLYIPYSIHLGKKYGFGTVMLGHTLYDLVTVLGIKFLLGA